MREPGEDIYEPTDDGSTGTGSVLQCICTLRHAQLNLPMIH